MKATRNAFIPRVALATAGVLALTAVTAHAVDMPKRKSGLWEIKTSVSGQNAERPPIQHCIDEKSDDLMRQSSKGSTACTDENVRRDGDRVIMHSVCKIGGSTATTDGVFTGKFDSNYRGEIKSKYSPPMMGMHEATTVIEAKWVGPCKPGMKPGDVVMPGMPAGMPNINMNEIMRQR